jgi:dephospho-CoA kinase
MIIFVIKYNKNQIYVNVLLLSRDATLRRERLIERCKLTDCILRERERERERERYAVAARNVG